MKTIVPRMIVLVCLLFIGPHGRAESCVTNIIDGITTNYIGTFFSSAQTFVLGSLGGNN